MNARFQLNRFSFFFIFFLANLISFTACDSPDVKQQNKQKLLQSPVETKEKTTETKNKSRKKRIVFFGDSLTAGYNLDEEYSFPSLIQKRIDSLGLDYESVNAGISGDTSGLGLKRLDWIMRQPIDVFVLELGANDALRGFELDVPQKNLQKIIDQLKAKYPDVKIVIAGMQAPPNLGSEYTDAFRKIYADLAKKNEAALIPFLLENVAAVPDLNLADGIHPNIEGQKIVMENVWRVLAGIL